MATEQEIEAAERVIRDAMVMAQDQARRLAYAALAAAEQSRAQVEGQWKLVPVKPTEEMIAAGRQLNHPRDEEIYTAYVAASPPPASQVTEEVHSICKELADIINAGCDAAYRVNMKFNVTAAKLYIVFAQRIERLVHQSGSSGDPLAVLRGLASNDGNPDQELARRALALVENTTELFHRPVPSSAQDAALEEVVRRTEDMRQWWEKNVAEIPDVPAFREQRSVLESAIIGMKAVEAAIRAMKGGEGNTVADSAGLKAGLAGASKGCRGDDLNQRGVSAPTNSPAMKGGGGER